MSKHWKPSTFRVPSLDISKAEKEVAAIMAEGFDHQKEGMEIRSLPLDYLTALSEKTLISR